MDGMLPVVFAAGRGVSFAHARVAAQQAPACLARDDEHRLPEVTRHR